jgi:outer membrane immunogenic protein
MRIRHCVAGLICLHVFTVSAFAAEKADRWSGPYAGASIGIGWGESTQTYHRAGDHGTATLDPDGAAAAISGGYNWMWTPEILFGVEGDLGVMNVSQGTTTVFDGHNWSTDIGPIWGTLRGRAGYTFDSVLIYATTGLAFANIDDTSIGNTPGETAIEKGLRAGWVIGTGVEYALDSLWTLKAEYLHMDFGSVEGRSANNEAYRFENTVNLLRVGANYRF